MRMPAPFKNHLKMLRGPHLGWTCSTVLLSTSRTFPASKTAGEKAAFQHLINHGTWRKQEFLSLLHVLMVFLNYFKMVVASLFGPLAEVHLCVSSHSPAIFQRLVKGQHGYSISTPQLWSSLFIGACASSRLFCFRCRWKVCCLPRLLDRSTFHKPLQIVVYYYYCDIDLP